jgi:hypothetical protein
MGGGGGQGGGQGGGSRSAQEGWDGEEAEETGELDEVLIFFLVRTALFAPAAPRLLTSAYVSICQHMCIYMYAYMCVYICIYLFRGGDHVRVTGLVRNIYI